MNNEETIFDRQLWPIVEREALRRPMGDTPIQPAESPAPAEIRAAREAAGLSQTDAAALIYAGLRGWQEWEAGNRKMDPAKWELFCLKTTKGSRHVSHI